MKPSRKRCANLGRRWRRARMLGRSLGALIFRNIVLAGEVLEVG